LNSNLNEGDRSQAKPSPQNVYSRTYDPQKNPAQSYPYRVNVRESKYKSGNTKGHTNESIKLDDILAVSEVKEI
jgi:hypothetical protein